MPFAQVAVGNRDDAARPEARVERAVGVIARDEEPLRRVVATADDDLAVALHREKRCDLVVRAGVAPDAAAADAERDVERAGRICEVEVDRQRRLELAGGRADRRRRERGERDARIAGELEHAAALSLGERQRRGGHACRQVLGRHRDRAGDRARARHGHRYRHRAAADHACLIGAERELDRGRLHHRRIHRIRHPRRLGGAGGEGEGEGRTEEVAHGAGTNSTVRAQRLPNDST
jgi:hypothetical protein